MSEQNLAEQKQKYKHKSNSQEIVGDCWRTAIACLLEMPRDDVPHFAQLYPDEPSKEWWYKSIEFVEEHKEGWTLVALYEEFGQPLFPVYSDLPNQPERVMLSRDRVGVPWRHVVIADSVTGKILWDPATNPGPLGGESEVYALIPKE